MVWQAAQQRRAMRPSRELQLVEQLKSLVDAIDERQHFPAQPSPEFQSIRHVEFSKAPKT